MIRRGKKLFFFTFLKIYIKHMDKLSFARLLMYVWFEKQHVTLVGTKCDLFRSVYGIGDALVEN